MAQMEHGLMLYYTCYVCYVQLYNTDICTVCTKDVPRTNNIFFQLGSLVRFCWEYVLYEVFSNAQGEK